MAAFRMSAGTDICTYNSAYFLIATIRNYFGVIITPLNKKSFRKKNMFLKLSQDPTFKANFTTYLLLNKFFSKLICTNNIMVNNPLAYKLMVENLYAVRFLIIFSVTV